MTALLNGVSCISIVCVVIVSIASEMDCMFPATLKGFGYVFNKDGQLRKIDTNTGEPGKEPFDFNVSEDNDYNQKRYEALGDVITEHVYSLLESETGLMKVAVPKEGVESESSFIFVSPDLFSKPERLLVLIHGSGVVRAGQWARRLIMNDSLQSGTQIPFIKRARELGYAVLVMNTNENFRIKNGRKVLFKNSSDPMEHADYVWEHYVQDSNAKHVAIIAHSYGGLITLELAHHYFSYFQNHVFAIALTDSVHQISNRKNSSRVLDYLRRVARNWAADDKRLDTPIQTRGDDIPRVSAGNTVHEWTSWSSFESIFRFLKERYNAVVNKHEL